MIQMGALKYSKINYYSLMFQGSKKTKSKEKEILKGKNPKSEIEYESSKPNDEDSMKKTKKKGSTSKCSYCRKGFYPENKCFKKNMDIMSYILENHNIKVPDELEKLVDSSKHYHSAQFQGDIKYALSARVK